MIRLIAAIDQNHGIAKGMHIPWNGRIPSDTTYWHKKTEYTCVLGGLKNFKSMGSKPMPNRRNVVVSHQQLHIPGIETIDDVSEFLQSTKEDIWVIGGGNIFAQTIDYAEELYLTRIDEVFNCDIFFPSFEHDFELKEQSKKYHEGGLDFVFQIWVRKKHH